MAGLASVRDEELGGPADPALLAEILAAPRARPARPRRRLLPAALAAAVVAASVAGLLAGTGSDGSGRASAASALREAASVARRRPPLSPKPGQYLYVKSVDTYLGTATDAPSFSILTPHVREIWLGLDRSRVHSITGRSRFPSERDRRNWIASGRPQLPGPAEVDAPTRRLRPLDLPSDPDALYARLEREAIGHGNSVPDEMLQLVGRSLRETNASPAQRAALYAVAARIPGVELVGRVTDSIGRRGVAVARDDRRARIRYTLVFDPRTSALLEEKQVLLAGNALRYPAGMRIGYTTYVKSGIVGSIGAKPS